MNIPLITDYAKRQLRNEFDEANGWEAIGIIDRTKEMGFDELATEMESDLKSDNDFHKQVNSDHNDSISEGARLNITYQALDRDGWPVLTESSKPCHTISNGIECYRCATTCAGLNNCELKKPKP